MSFMKPVAHDLFWDKLLCRVELHFPEDSQFRGELMITGEV